MALNNPVADKPNNVLALEYMKQLKAVNSDILPCAVMRKGVDHDSNEASGSFLSASAVRSGIKSGKDIGRYVPDNTLEILKSAQENGEMPSDISKIELAILSKLRSMTADDLSEVADVNEGLEYRLEKAISQATSLEELHNLVLTKRYTNAKIRRIILCAFLGVTKEMQKEIPDYINVLACNGKGIEIIKKIKENSVITVITKHSESENLEDADKTLYRFTDKCDDQFGLTLPKVRKCGYNREHKFEVV